MVVVFKCCNQIRRMMQCCVFMCMIFTVIKSTDVFLPQRVGCDRVLGSTAVPDACGMCKGDNSTCKIYKGQYTKQHFTNRTSHKSIIHFTGFCGFICSILFIHFMSCKNCTSLSHIIFIIYPSPSNWCSLISLLLTFCFTYFSFLPLLVITVS